MKFLQLSALFLLVSLHSLAIAEGDRPVRYYPGSSHQLPVGSEEYLKNHASLAGIEGAYVLLDYVKGSSKANNIAMSDDLEAQIIRRFEAAGLKFLTKEEMDTTPGKPELAIYPAYSGGSIGQGKLIGASSASQADQCAVGGSNHCCRNSVWMSFMQSATILRRPDSQFKFGTWGAGDDSNWCENRGEWMYGAVLKVIDDFINDYTKAEAENKPLKIASEKEIPLNCAQAWSLHKQVFETNSTKPNPEFLSILTKLADQSRRCSNYSYLIETHADTRSDEQYNQLLTEARAASIKEFLMASGISYNRLKSRAFGESMPLTSGTTEADHAVNRRVVIIPVLGTAFKTMGGK